ncbi:caspase domain-containing protein [Fomitopsis serialis]|uniref:caspase domain-containing protein n=1 Tax=Fomitopsis serialis TaxID=139415 RepID=UPI002007FB01|nr:caspase domain-containing protein [Neoantrodia serialis]KAH9922519.1 caspase domain-containing protein [Neoantrodia serialis]
MRSSTRSAQDGCGMCRRGRRVSCILLPHFHAPCLCVTRAYLQTSRIGPQRTGCSASHLAEILQKRGELKTGTTAQISRFPVTPCQSPSQREETPLKKALSIAVQYSSLSTYEPPLDLAGTHNDPKILSALLVDLYGYDSNNITILMDDDPNGDPQRLPTKENIVGQVSELCSSSNATLPASPRLSAVYLVSGHGAQVSKGDTEKTDDVIWPADVEVDSDGNFANYIMDDEIHDILVKHIPVGAHFMMVFDCCHSGTLAELPNDNERDTPPLTPSSATSGTMSIPPNVNAIRVRGSHDVRIQRETREEEFKPAVPFTHNLDENAPSVVADIVNTGWAQGRTIHKCELFCARLVLKGTVRCTSGFG